MSKYPLDYEHCAVETIGLSRRTTVCGLLRPDKFWFVPPLNPSQLGTFFCSEKLATSTKPQSTYSILFREIGKENLNGAGLEPKTSGVMYNYKCSSIWAIQPLDGGPPK